VTWKLVFSTIKTTRMTLARLARRVADGELDDLQRARLVHDIAKSVLSAHKMEHELRVEERLSVIEDALREDGKMK
jgi:polyhydroxyalkanoate synthesis regulator protein